MLVALAMAPQVNCYHSMRVLEIIELWGHIRVVTRPAMYEQEWQLTTPGLLKTQSYSISV